MTISLKLLRISDFVFIALEGTDQKLPENMKKYSRVIHCIVFSEECESSQIFAKSLSIITGKPR